MLSINLKEKEKIEFQDLEAGSMYLDESGALCMKKDDDEQWGSCFVFLKKFGTWEECVGDKFDTMVTPLEAVFVLNEKN